MDSPIVRDSKEFRIWQSTSERAATFYPGIGGRVCENGGDNQASPRSYDLDSDALVWNANSGARRDNIVISSFTILREKVQGSRPVWEMKLHSTDTKDVLTSKFKLSVVKV